MGTVVVLTREMKSSSEEMEMMRLSREKLELTVKTQKLLALVKILTNGSPVSQQFDLVTSSVPGIFVIPVVNSM